MDDKRDRAKKANELIEVVAAHGRNFFGDKPNRLGVVSRFEIDYRGHIWFWDAYSRVRIYLGYKHWSKGFSHGGTLRDFVNALARYIRTGETIPSCYLGPWSHNGDNYWGYGDDMRVVRAKASALGITSSRSGGEE